MRESEGIQKERGLTKKVLLFSTLLLVGLIGSQWLPGVIGAEYTVIGYFVRILTMIALSFIMIRVGYEFDIDKSNLRRYGWDYAVAATAAAFPWVFVALYFIFVLLPPDFWGTLAAWQESLLAGRFAAPTSAGVLFSMLTAAGLGATWLFRKARVLAIFDDVDTILLMIPLKMLIVGVAWQLGVIVLVLGGMLTIAFVFLHRVRIPVTWPWVLSYAAGITTVSELVYRGSKLIDASVPIHLEVLLPAFALGCIMAYPGRSSGDEVHGNVCHHEIETRAEKRVTTLMAASFMVLVGLSMPNILGADLPLQAGATAEAANTALYATTVPVGRAVPAEIATAEIATAQEIGRVTAEQPPMGWSEMIIHVLAITALANLGKMFPALCYRSEACRRERLALAIGMWPRGEVGAGVLVVSLSYGIGGPIVAIAMMSLALNLLLTGVFIFIVNRLTSPLEAYGECEESIGVA